MEFDGGERTASGEIPVDDHPSGSNDGTDGRTFGFDGQRGAEFQGPESEVEIVAGHVAPVDAAVVPIDAPVLGMKVGVIRMFWRGTEPQVPMHVFRDG